MKFIIEINLQHFTTLR